MKQISRGVEGLVSGNLATPVLAVSVALLDSCLPRFPTQRQTPNGIITKIVKRSNS